MSWSLTSPEIKEVVAEEADRLLEQNQAPQSIKGYVSEAIEGLVEQFGEDVKVTVTGYGHLHNGNENDLSTSTATIEVRKA